MAWHWLLQVPTLVDSILTCILVVIIIFVLVWFLCLFTLSMSAWLL
jgi:hypothetical protein